MKADVPAAIPHVICGVCASVSLSGISRCQGFPCQLPTLHSVSFVTRQTKLQSAKNSINGYKNSSAEIISDVGN